VERTVDEFPQLSVVATSRTATAFVACMIPLGAMYASDCGASGLLDALCHLTTVLLGAVDLPTRDASGVIQAIHPILSTSITLVGLSLTRNLWFQRKNYTLDARNVAIAFGALFAVLIFGLAAWTSILRVFGFQTRIPGLYLDLSIIAVLRTIYLVGLAPISEELLFRDCLYETLRRQSFAPAIVIATSASVFAIIHLSDSLGFVRGVYIFACGLLFGAIRHFSRNVPASIAAHMGLNLAASFLE
jgi:membrane protease YdiL (CAAX protease family)